MKVQNGVLSIILFCLIFFPGVVFSQTAKVSWNDNTEADLAGYKLYCGTESGSYQYTLDVGLYKPVYLKGLQDGLTYYVAVSAYDWACNESPLSEEIQQTLSADSQSDDLLNIVLHSKEFLYQLDTYDPATPLTLQNSLAGIRVEIPAGAADVALPVALGSDDPSAWASTEFDVVPDGYELSAPAVVTAPVISGGKTVYVELFDETAWAWVRIEDFTINSNIVKFSTLKLGRFRIYPDGVDPNTRKIIERSESSAISGNGGSSGGGGGGGGCFMQSVDKQEVGSDRFLFLSFLIFLSCAAAYLRHKESV